MQFHPDIEACIRDPRALRRLSEPRRTEVLTFLRLFRRSWHAFRARCGYADSQRWITRPRAF